MNKYSFGVKLFKRRILLLLAVALLVFTTVELSSERKPEKEQTVTVIYCGQREHTHAGNCFNEIGILTCTRAEHKHTDECFDKNTVGRESGSDSTADVVSPEELESTLSAIPLTGDRRHDLVAVAEAQLGYRESVKNYETDSEGEKKGYSKYGEWYGIPYGNWCAMFASFCIHGAEIEDIPVDASCTRWVRNLKRAKLYHNKGEYEPQAGDLAFFDKAHEGGGSSDHVAIVREVLTENGKVTGIVTVEGNCYNAVRSLRYKIYKEDCPIIGFAEMG